MVITMWTLFFVVMFVIIVFLAMIYAILDGIHYHEEAKLRRFEEFSNQEPDWMNKND